MTVTVADQTLTDPVQSDGTWSVTPTHLADGPHQVVMTVSDAAGNQASATQTLTVNTVAPVVLITGGANATTTSFNPTISGSTDTSSPGSTITVTMAGQTRTTLVQPDGSWDVSFFGGAAGPWQVHATVTDGAGNVGSATQTLTITAGPAGDTGPTGPPARPGHGPTPARAPAPDRGGAGATGRGCRGRDRGDRATGSAGATGPRHAGGAGATGRARERPGARGRLDPPAVRERLDLRAARARMDPPEAPGRPDPRALPERPG